MPVKMQICSNPECGKFLQLVSTKFCTVCGGETADAPVCKCKEAISKYDKFCPTCGRPTQTT
jgi:predicted amidophosphoribosyltransferase